MPQGNVSVRYGGSVSRSVTIGYGEGRATPTSTTSITRKTGIGSGRPQGSAGAPASSTAGSVANSWVMDPSAVAGAAEGAGASSIVDSMESCSAPSASSVVLSGAESAGTAASGIAPTPLPEDADAHPDGGEEADGGGAAVAHERQRDPGHRHDAHAHAGVLEHAVGHEG